MPAWERVYEPIIEEMSNSSHLFLYALNTIKQSIFPAQNAII